MADIDYPIDYRNGLFVGDFVVARPFSRHGYIIAIHRRQFLVDLYGIGEIWFYRMDVDKTINLDKIPETPNIANLCVDTDEDPCTLGEWLIGCMTLQLQQNFEREILYGSAYHKENYDPFHANTPVFKDIKTI